MTMNSCSQNYSPPESLNYISIGKCRIPHYQFVDLQKNEENISTERNDVQAEFEIKYRIK